MCYTILGIEIAPTAINLIFQKYIELQYNHAEKIKYLRLESGVGLRWSC